MLLDDLDLLDADLMGAELNLGDDYLQQHPEIQRGPKGRPLRGMLLPVSDREKGEWKKIFGTQAPARAYQGPSYEELKKRDPSTWNDAERYWIATISGDKAEIERLKQLAELALQRDLAHVDTREARAQVEYERTMREIAERNSGFLGSLGKAVKYLPWILGGVVVVGVGVPVLTSLIPVRRYLTR